MHSPHPPSGSAPAPRSSRPRRVLFALALGFAGLLALGVVPRVWRANALTHDATETSERLPSVSVATARLASAHSTLVLPGEIEPYQEAAIFARANGYLTRRLVDIGDRVRRGQLLAEVASPEIDKEADRSQAALAQAESHLVAARTERSLALVTNRRWQALRQDGSVARQDADEKQAAFQVRSAAVSAAEADVRAARNTVQRLAALQAFEQLRAPFAGTITARGVDAGALIAAGSGGSLFKLAQIDRLRIHVHVPEPYAPAIRIGGAVRVDIRELGQGWPGHITRTAGALDAASRTMLAEVVLANPGRLMPGMYAQVKLEAARAVPVIEVPGTAIMTRGQGASVAVVAPDHVVHIRPVQIGRDDGLRVEVLSGVRAGDRLVVSPSDEIQEGSRIRLEPNTAGGPQP